MIGFEEFELCRSANRRSREELIIPAYERRAMLREVDYSNSIIQEFAVENMLIKSQVLEIDSVLGFYRDLEILNTTTNLDRNYLIQLGCLLLKLFTVID